MTSARPYERLYLLKDGKQDIFVDLYQPLQQHQIDGVRFLYRQFKKKTPGIILNDPSGYGKTVQTVVFLQAIRSLLDKPVLILCSEKDINNWQEQFHKWTEFTDLSIQQNNPFAASRIHVNTFEGAGQLARRSWAVVVVQDSTFSKETFQKHFRADFRVWITSVDMKTNLPVLTSIYEWLHPNTKVNLEEIAPSRPDDVITKSILLDAFLEDIVLRRHDFWTPYMKPVTEREIPVTVSEKTKPYSRKNKDPTGTKVKRSKIKKIESDDDEFIPTLLVNNGTDREIIPSSITSDNFKTTQDNNTNNINDVKSFIPDKNTIDSEQFKEPNVKINGDSENIQSDTFNEIQNAINEIIDNENRIESNMDVDETDTNITNNKSPDMFTEETQTSVSIKVKTANPDTNAAVEISNIKNEILDKGDKIKLEDENSTDVSDTQFLEQKVKMEQDIIVSDTHLKDKVKIEEGSSKVISDTQFLEEKVQAEHKNANKNTKSDMPNASTKSDMPKVKNEKCDDFDIQFAEQEEKIMKKFKGSFLDTLF